MIVDHSNIIIDRIAAYLSGITEIARIHTANSFGAAEVMLEEVKPEIVLLDIFLPENDSFRLFRKCRQTNKNTSFILMYNHFDLFYRQYFMTPGGAVFIDKNKEFEKIPAMINFLMSKRNISNSNHHENRKTIPANHT